MQTVWIYNEEKYWIKKVLTNWIESETDQLQTKWPEKELPKIVKDKLPTNEHSEKYTQTWSGSFYEFIDIKEKKIRKQSNPNMSSRKKIVLLNHRKSKLKSEIKNCIKNDKIGNAKRLMQQLQSIGLNINEQKWLVKIKKSITGGRKLGM